MLFVDERVEVKITRKYVCVALQIDNSTKSIQGQSHIWSKIPWLKVLPSLDTIMILLNELRDIYVCFRRMVTMMEVIEERTYSAKRVAPSSLDTSA